MNDELRCEQVRELAPELALDIAGGKERDEALRHAASCAECRQLVADLSAMTDELLLLAPEHAPSTGFRQRVLADLVEPTTVPHPGMPTRSSGRPLPGRRGFPRLAIAAALVLAIALGAGVVFSVTAPDRQLAAGYRTLLSRGHGSFFAVATLRGSNGEVGSVFGYQGQPSWVYATTRLPVDGRFRVLLLTTDGRTIPLGVADFQAAGGGWGRVLPVSLDAVSGLRFVGQNGVAELTAVFGAQDPWK